MKTLAEVAVGEHVRIAEIDGTDDISVRLMEMGLAPGIELTLIGAAPLGDPVEIEVRGYRLSIRKSEARRVKVD